MDGVSSSLLSVAVIKTMTKSNLEKKEFVWLAYPNHSPSLWEVMAGTQTGQELEARMDAVATRGMWLA